MSTKRIIQISSIIITIIFILSAFTWIGYAQAASYRTDLEYTYRRALNDLNTHINDMNVTLTKANYANTSSQQNGMAGRLMKNTSGAKAALAVLPIGNDSLNNVNKFISQVGDFASSISSKLSVGESLSDEDKNILHAICYHATGIDNMSELDKVIYCADKLDPLRGWDSTKLIEECKKDINQGFISVLKENIIFFKKKNIDYKNNYTLKCLSYYLDRKDYE